jgi:histidinol-phosphate aminotransferase
VLVFFDEAYFEYVDAKDYPDTLRLLKANKNILITRTFSKMYGLAGLRIGYGIGNPGLIDILNRLREPFNVNSVAQAAALACLKERGYYRQLARRFAQQRQYLYRNLTKLGLDFKKSVTNFVLIDVGQDSSKICGRLLKKGIIVRDMKFWGLKNTIRVSLGTPQENKKLISTLEEIL